MCSILGILEIRADAQGLRDQALELSRRQRHRGPDWSGVFACDRAILAHERLSALALGVILAGAVGNLIDRLVYGEVIDFLDVHLTAGYTWPTFNIADSCIVVGVGLLIAEIFLAEDPEAAAAAASPDGEVSGERDESLQQP